jgi:hypothetical protein
MTDLDRPAYPVTRTENIDLLPGQPAVAEVAHCGLTTRQHAAITLRVPDSGDAALDAMIREARRWDAAAQMAAAYIAHLGAQEIHASKFISECASEGRHFADALLAELERER